MFVASNSVESNFLVFNSSRGRNLPLRHGNSYCFPSYVRPPTAFFPPFVKSITEKTQRQTLLTFSSVSKVFLSALLLRDWEFFRKYTFWFTLKKIILDFISEESKWCFTKDTKNGDTRRILCTLFLRNQDIAVTDFEIWANIFNWSWISLLAKFLLWVFLFSTFED